jgi:hypothetical protein
MYTHWTNFHSKVFGSNYHYTSSVTSMIDTTSPGWPTLAERRLKTRLIMMYKITHALIAIPTDSRTRKSHNQTFRHITTQKDTYSTLQVYQRSYSQVGHIPPKMSDSLQRNVRQIWESTLSKSDYLVGHESGYLKIFFTFLEVNMSNILWSMHICKRTFFPVCRMSGYVNTLVYFYLAPYSRQER